MSLLKSLELHGYKTFASRTLFEFPGDVTAIVGPNGSGKSNIADALRWVLGEQSYSLLRGRKTEDMIFSGSEMRPRAGMASATITFDNENGWLPIDFSEGHHPAAYRDGTNEYLLNGQRVRLKEISEMLAQRSGRTHVYDHRARAGRCSPVFETEERRRFFEEAAGIGLFRARRRNHSTGWTPHGATWSALISSASWNRACAAWNGRQNGRWRHRLRTDCACCCAIGMVSLEPVPGGIGALREVVKVQEERLNQVRERQTEIEAELSRVRGSLQELRGKLNVWHSQSAGLHTERERVSRALAVMDERQLSLAAQKRSAESDLARLEEEQKARQDRLAELEEERTRLQEEMKEAGERAAQARSAVEKRQAERGQLETRLRETGGRCWMPKHGRFR
jgi:chromosome segregation protein